jgi:hypothetical protein
VPGRAQKQKKKTAAQLEMLVMVRDLSIARVRVFPHWRHG